MYSVIIKYPPSVKKLHETLIKLTKNILDKYWGLKQAFLFGSYARSKPHYRSDVDLMFIVSENTNIRFEDIYTELINLSLEFDWAPLVMEEAEFNRRHEESDPWIRTILKEGKEIWPNYYWTPK